MLFLLLLILIYLFIFLGITTVLTLSTFGLDTKTDLPKVSYPTALDWFVIMCFTFVIATLLEFAGVHYFTKIGFGEFPCIESGFDSETDDSFSSTRLGPRTVSGRDMVMQLINYFELG